MTRYMTDFSNCNHAIPPNLLLLLFLSISFHSVLLLFLLPEPLSLVASGKLRKWKIQYLNAPHRMDSEPHFRRFQNQFSLPKFYVRLLQKLVFPKNIQSLIIISLMRRTTTIATLCLGLRETLVK